MIPYPCSNVSVASGSSCTVARNEWRDERREWDGGSVWAVAEAEGVLDLDLDLDFELFLCFFLEGLSFGSSFAGGLLLGT